MTDAPAARSDAPTPIRDSASDPAMTVTPAGPGGLAIALVSAAIIAYELAVMRIFANGGWSHFGSTVVSIAMFGFGVFSTLLCLTREWFRRHWQTAADTALVLLGPAMLLANTVAQRIPFNPIFLVSDPDQKWWLVAYFLIYFVPFVVGAAWLGLVFLAGKDRFGRVYFANMAGSGLGGMVLFFALSWLAPAWLLVVPAALWLAGAVTAIARDARRARSGLIVAAAVTGLLLVGCSQLQVSPYKGVSYARNFPDAQCVYRRPGPFGLLEVYGSSYFHFAPGLSDTAGLYLETMPKQAFLGMYQDGDGPTGLMRRLGEGESDYLRYLPMALPYLLASEPAVFVMRFGGGISTNGALGLGARSVTVAEDNPMVVAAIRDDPWLASFTGGILRDPRVRLIEHDGRIAIREHPGAFDLVDLSLADSTGLSMPGGFSIHENYTYTRETLAHCMAALRPGGILSLTVWNKEDPPKSTLKLLTTVFAAARLDAANRRPRADPPPIADRLFVTHTYLSTLTVLYKPDGFTPAETERLRRRCRKLSFSVLHPAANGHGPRAAAAPTGPVTRSEAGPEGEPATPAAPLGPAGSPGTPPDAETIPAVATRVFRALREQLLGLDSRPAPRAVTATGRDADTATGVSDGGASAGLPGDHGATPDPTDEPMRGPDPTLATAGDVDVSADNIYRLALQLLLIGEDERLQREYLFDTRPLTNERPYFAGFVKPADLPRFSEQLEAIADEWGYLLLWATLLLATALGAVLMVIPLLFGRQFYAEPAAVKLGTVGYFWALGIGYIVVELALIGKVLLCLGNPTVSVAVMITGMLLFSGIGSYLSSSVGASPRRPLAGLLLGVVLLLLGLAGGADTLLERAATWSYPARIAWCLGLTAPLALLMGFPFAIGMSTLARHGREHLFVWAWGINGSFSVAGSVLVPILAVSWGLSAGLWLGAAAYLLALPAFILLDQPREEVAA